MGTYSLSDRLSNDQSWKIPYRQFANQDALGLTEGVSDITEQFGRQRQELAQKTQDKFGGGHVSGGTYAADRAERKAKEDLLRTSAMRGMQMAAREADQAMKYSQFDRTLEHQTAMREMEIAARKELHHLEAAQRELDRQAQKEMAAARNETQKASIASNHQLTTSNIKLRARQAQEQIAASQQRRGVGGGGGGGMGVSYSTGATGFEDHLRRMGVMA